MKEFFRLPYDPSGYGDFGVSYIGTECRIHFQYEKVLNELVGELYFDFCISILVNGNLDKQLSIPYDTILYEEFISKRYDGFYRYVFMLSGSDFQFEVIAKGCTFSGAVEGSTLIASD